MTKCNCPIDKIVECFSFPNCRLNRPPEALRLADSIEDIQGLNTIDGTLVDHAARELRRLHEVNAELLAALRMSAAAQRHALAVSMFDDPLLVQADISERNARAAIAKAEGETEYD